MKCLPQGRSLWETKRRELSERECRRPISDCSNFRLPHQAWGVELRLSDELGREGSDSESCEHRARILYGTLDVGLVPLHLVHGVLCLNLALRHHLPISARYTHATPTSDLVSDLLSRHAWLYGMCMFVPSLLAGTTMSCVAPEPPRHVLRGLSPSCLLAISCDRSRRRLRLFDVCDESGVWAPGVCGGRPMMLLANPATTTSSFVSAALPPQPCHCAAASPACHFFPSCLLLRTILHQCCFTAPLDCHSARWLMWSPPLACQLGRAAPETASFPAAAWPSRRR